MRYKMMVTLAFVASLSLLAGGGAAQAQNPPAPAAQSDQGQHGARSSSDTAGAGMMTPDMMRMMGSMASSSQSAGGRGRDGGNPLQMVSRLMTALNDPHARAMLGISDQQADSLQKLVTDTEILTIQKGADIAVNSLQLQELLRPDKPDKAAVMAKGDLISKDTSELISHYLGAILEAKTILTPEQQKMIREYLDNGAPPLPGPPARP
jgi:hypothetical protein